jgi:hypothetical protein
MRLELLPPFGVPPTLQQTVHVQIGQQGTHHSTLRSSAVVVLPSGQPPVTVPVPFLDRNLEPHLYQTQHIPIYDATATHCISP